MWVSAAKSDGTHMTWERRRLACTVQKTKEIPCTVQARRLRSHVTKLISVTDGLAGFTQLYRINEKPHVLTFICFRLQ